MSGLAQDTEDVELTVRCSEVRTSLADYGLYVWYDPHRFPSVNPCPLSRFRGAARASAQLLAGYIWRHQRTFRDRTIVEVEA